MILLQPVCQPVCLSVCMTATLSACLSVNLPDSQSVSLPVSLETDRLTTEHHKKTDAPPPLHIPYDPFTVGRRGGDSRQAGRKVGGKNPSTGHGTTTWHFGAHTGRKCADEESRWLVSHNTPQACEWRLPTSQNMGGGNAADGWETGHGRELHHTVRRKAVRDS